MPVFERTADFEAAVRDNHEASEGRTRSVQGPSAGRIRPATNCSGDGVAPEVNQPVCPQEDHLGRADHWVTASTSPSSSAYSSTSPRTSACQAARSGGAWWLRTRRRKLNIRVGKCTAKLWRQQYAGVRAVVDAPIDGTFGRHPCAPANVAAVSLGLSATKNEAAEDGRFRANNRL